MAEIVVRADCGAVVLTLSVAAGQQVENGQELLVLESMKTEIPVPSPVSGRVAAVKVAEGDLIEERQPLIVLET